MKRMFALALSLLLLISLAGCRQSQETPGETQTTSQEENQNKTFPSDNKEPSTGQAANNEEALAGKRDVNPEVGIEKPTEVSPLPVKDQLEQEPVSLSEEFQNKYNLKLLEGLPKYIQAVDWLDAQNLLVQAGSNPLILNVDSGEYKALNFSPWWIKVSPDRKMFAFRDEEGIKIYNFKEQKSILAISQDTNKSGITTVEGNSAVDGALWSPTGNRILTWAVSEWGAEYFIFNCKSSSLEKIPVALENYFLIEPVGWIDEGKLLFAARASQKKDGTQEYSLGYRQDFAVFNLADNSFQLITDVDDGTFLSNAAIIDQAKVIYRRNQQNDPGEIAASNWFIKDLETGSEEPFDFKEKADAVYYNPADYQFLYLTEGDQEGLNNHKQIQDTDGRNLLEVVFDSHFSGIKWSPDGRRAAISLSAQREGSEVYNLYLLERKDDKSNADGYGKMLSQMFPESNFQETATGCQNQEGQTFNLASREEGSFTKAGADEYMLIFKRPSAELSHAGGFYNAFAAVFDSRDQIASEVLPLTADEGSYHFFAGKDLKYLLFAGSVTFQGWTDWNGGLWQAGSKWQKIWPQEEDFWENKAVQINNDGLVVLERKVLQSEALIPDYEYQEIRKLRWSAEKETFVEIN